MRNRPMPGCCPRLTRAPMSARGAGRSGGNARHGPVGIRLDRMSGLVQPPQGLNKGVQQFLPVQLVERPTADPHVPHGIEIVPRHRSPGRLARLVRLRRDRAPTGFPDPQQRRSPSRPDAEGRTSTCRRLGPGSGESDRPKPATDLAASLFTEMFCFTSPDVPSSRPRASRADEGVMNRRAPSGIANSLWAREGKPKPQ